jgi:hypothetical protein
LFFSFGGFVMVDGLPKVRCQLVGEDGNAFAILGRFRKAARAAGWPGDEIQKVLDDAMSGDYDHLLCTIMVHCDDEEEEEDDDYGDEFDDEE